jgi:hypothetical protein
MFAPPGAVDWDGAAGRHAVGEAWRLVAAAHRALRVAVPFPRRIARRLSPRAVAAALHGTPLTEVASPAPAADSTSTSAPTPTPAATSASASASAPAQSATWASATDSTSAPEQVRSRAASASQAQPAIWSSAARDGTASAPSEGAVASSRRPPSPPASPPSWTAERDGPRRHREPVSPASSLSRIPSGSPVPWTPSASPVSPRSPNPVTEALTVEPPVPAPSTTVPSSAAVPPVDVYASPSVTATLPLVADVSTTPTSVPHVDAHADGAHAAGVPAEPAPWAHSGFSGFPASPNPMAEAVTVESLLPRAPSTPPVSSASPDVMAEAVTVESPVPALPPERTPSMTANTSYRPPSG